MILNKTLEQILEDPRFRAGAEIEVQLTGEFLVQRGPVKAVKGSQVEIFFDLDWVGQWDLATDKWELLDTLQPPCFSRKKSELQVVGGSEDVSGRLTAVTLLDKDRNIIILRASDGAKMDLSVFPEDDILRINGEAACSPS